MAKRGALEVHFAVSDKVGVYSGKDAVSHIGISVGGTGYNCGRNEGRDDEGITSKGPYVAVKSPYRLDGFYLKLTDTDEIAKTFQEFVDGYLGGTLDANGKKVNVQNTALQIPSARLNTMWFTKTVQGLGALSELKKLKNVNYVTYERTIRPQHSVLNSIDFEEFEDFLHADTAGEELDVFKESYPFMSQMTAGQYSRIRAMNATDTAAFAALLVDLKRDLGNRMYDTRVLTTKEFGSGTYNMVGGYNCVRAAFFFLDRGLVYAAGKLPKRAGEIQKMQELVTRLQEGNQKLKMPWRSFRRARWHSDDYAGSGFVDTPEDSIFWKDIKKVVKEARLTDKAKKKALRPSQRSRLIAKLTQKTDVTEYEQEGIEYVSSSRLTPEMKNRCAPYMDLLTGFGMGKGGGKRTRFV